ncbi:response regulator transcription factor [Neobacillus drentensis]|uniref:helix-turn-helix transcriptional regulator n=1 Tax=Neobacillus drentensis TaxID=220684 RepID=UPI001F459EE4|nr:response regulator transcription factor [Neobacillus drentensis]ULT58675.1 response regulator transcription factor [Neobacillus drentensis]
MNFLSDQNVKNILIFMDEINYLKGKINYAQILYLFEKYFGYSRSEMYLFDQNYDLTLLHSINIEQKAIDEYFHYDQTDFNWHPRRALPPNGTNVIKIFDVVSKEDYEKSRFYKDYLEIYGYYDLLSMCFYHEKGRFGCITFSRQREDTPFNQVDVMQLEIISKFMSPKIWQSLIESQTDLSSHNQSHSESHFLDFLSKREREVLELVQKGLSNEDVSRQLFISINTVKTHLLNIFKKLKVTNRTELCYKINQKILL